MTIQTFTITVLWSTVALNIFSIYWNNKSRKKYEEKNKNIDEILRRYIRVLKFLRDEKTPGKLVCELDNDEAIAKIFEKKI